MPPNVCVLKEPRPKGDLAVPSQPLTPGGHRGLLSCLVPAQLGLDTPPSLDREVLLGGEMGVWKQEVPQTCGKTPKSLGELELVLLVPKCPYCDQPEGASHSCCSRAESSRRGPWGEGGGLSGWEGWGGVCKPCPIRVRGLGAPSNQNRGRAPSRVGWALRPPEALVCTCPVRLQVSGSASRSPAWAMEPRGGRQESLQRGREMVSARGRPRPGGAGSTAGTVWRWPRPGFLSPTPLQVLTRVSVLGRGVGSQRPVPSPRGSGVLRTAWGDQMSTACYPPGGRGISARS